MREIDRILFCSLNKDTAFGGYIVLCDQNFKEKFYAEDDAAAKEMFHTKYETR